MTVSTRTVIANGNEMAALALRHVDPDVMALYPITPSTAAAELVSGWVSDGAMTTELILTEGENSALTACVAASAAGARTATITCSQGLLYMAQQVFIASGMRRPVVLAIATREVSAPLNIHGGHSDVMAFRDSGAVMLFAKNHQEIYDKTLQAFAIGEHPDVMLPVFVCYDGFLLSHTSVENTILSDNDLGVLRTYLGTYAPRNALLDTDHPSMHGALVLPDHFMEIKRAQRFATEQAARVITDVAKSFSEQFWETSGLVEAYQLDDAERVIVIMGGSFGTVKRAVDRARASGIRAGVLRIVSYRPFPTELVRAQLCDAHAIAVLDRSDSFGGPTAPLAGDIRSALAHQAFSPPVLGYVYGLGGRELRTEDVMQLLLHDLADPASRLDLCEPTYINVRGGHAFGGTP